MQKLLLYEMSVVNDVTKRTVETRDILNLNLITYYETLLIILAQYNISLMIISVFINKWYSYIIFA